MTLADDVGSGDQRRALEALRDLLAASLLEAAPGSRAPLAKQLREVLTRLDSLEGPAADSTVARLSEARRQRLARHQNGAS